MTSAVTSEEDTKPVILSSVPEATPMVYDDFVYLDASESMPRLHTADSSCSDHVLSPEVESAAPPKMTDWEKSALDFPFGYLDGGASLIGSQFQANYPMESMPDMLEYISKPF